METLIPSATMPTIENEVAINEVINQAIPVMTWEPRILLGINLGLAFDVRLPGITWTGSLCSQFSVSAGVLLVVDVLQRCIIQNEYMDN